MPCGRVPYARSGERRFAPVIGYQQLMLDLGGKNVVFLLEPGELGLQVTHAPLKAAHFSYDAGIRPADVAV
jgi:hypothetical protein